MFFGLSWESATIYFPLLWGKCVLECQILNLKRRLHKLIVRTCVDVFWPGLCEMKLVRNSLILQIFILVLWTLLDPANKQTVVKIYSVLKLLRCSLFPITLKFYDDTPCYEYNSPHCVELSSLWVFSTGKLKTSGLEFLKIAYHVWLDKKIRH